MDKKPKISKKTREKIEWLNTNYRKYEYEDDLIEEMSKTFNVCKKHCPRIIKVFLGEKSNLNDKRNKFNSKEKILIGDKESCYFCGVGDKLLSHHICYVPEKIVFLCKSCHNKIHYILSENHKDNLEIGDKFILLKGKVNEMIKVLDYSY